MGGMPFDRRPGAGAAPARGREVGLTDRDGAARERLSGLSAAVLRINATLDVDSVLREVVDSARSLTGARYGAIATTDDGDGIVEFVTSGFSAEQRRALMERPDGTELFAQFNVQTAWQECEGQRRNLASVGMNKPWTLADLTDLTQRAYLGLPPTYQWLREYRDRSSQQRGSGADYVDRLPDEKGTVPR